MELGYFIRGVVIGFSIAAPVGPIGILCIQRTLNQGAFYGFISGLGAATADGCYGLIAAFSLTAALGILSGIRTWFSLAGGLYLVYLGIKAFRTVPESQNNSSKSFGLMGAYLSIYFLTLTNPMTILSFAAIFAGFGLGGADQNYLSAGLLVAGVSLGSAMWWLLLSSAAGLLRHKFTTQHLQWVNRMSGCVIMGFGVFIIGRLIH